MIRQLLVGLAAVLSVAPAVADEKLVDNPDYKNWSQFKPGTSVVERYAVKLVSVTEETVTTRTLVEVKKDEVVLQEVAVRNLGGRESKGSPKEVKIPRLVLSVGPDPRTAKPNGKKEDGKKKLKVDGTEYACDWVKVTEAVGTFEHYLCDDVPGGRLKYSILTEDGVTTIELTSVTIKK